MNQEQISRGMAEIVQEQTRTLDMAEAANRDDLTGSEKARYIGLENEWQMLNAKRIPIARTEPVDNAGGFGGIGGI